MIESLLGWLLDDRFLREQGRLRRNRGRIHALMVRWRWNRRWTWADVR
jgi:hypothetical protein